MLHWLLDEHAFGMSMLAAFALLALGFVFGCEHARADLRWPAFAPSQGACLAPLSAVSNPSSSCIDIRSTAAAFAPPILSVRVGTRFRWPCATLQLSDFCWAFVLRSFVLQASFPLVAVWAQPNRSLRVRTTNFVTLSLPIRVQHPANIGFRHWRLAHPLHAPYGTSLSFARFTHLRLLPHTPSRASQRLASL